MQVKQESKWTDKPTQQQNVRTIIVDDKKRKNSSQWCVGNEAEINAETTYLKASFIKIIQCLASIFGFTFSAEVIS